MAAEDFRNFFEIGIMVNFHIFAIKPVWKLPIWNSSTCSMLSNRSCFSGTILLLTRQRTFVFMSPVASYCFFQSIIVLMFTLNTAVVYVTKC